MKNQIITITDLEKMFVKRIPKKFKIEINKYIHTDLVQSYLKKALQYNTDSISKKELDPYPKLYWLLFIYIHPLTIVQGILENLIKINREVNS